jgi:hypothetical protein
MKISNLLFTPVTSLIIFLVAWPIIARYTQEMRYASTPVCLGLPFGNNFARKDVKTL